MRKPVIFAALALGVLGLIWASGGVPADLDGLRAALAHAEGWRAAHPAAFAALFFAAYVTVTALSLPFAVWMTLAAGAVFGFWGGLVLVSFASTLGATLAFLAARFLLRDWVMARLGARAKAVEQGLERDGAFYLFSLRLIPVVPFFALNLLMGLTAMPARRFYWVSQLGMLPGTAVYTNAGTQLGRIDSLSGVISAPVLGAFAALAVFPWLARLLLGVLRRRRAYRGYTRPARFDRNLIVIGAGAAGLVTAYVAAAAKARVTLIEAHKMGGDCLNYGCVPSKGLIRSAKVAHQMRHADRFGLTPADPGVSFRAVMARVRQVIADIAPHDSVERYEGLGVEVLQGHARLIDPWTVEVTGEAGAQRLTARAIVLATGAAPVIPDLPGLADVGPLTSDTLWDRLADRDTPPAQLLLLGGGPIGCELAQAFQRLGSQVTLVEQGPRLLPRDDAEAAELVRASLVADGVQVLTGHRALAFGAQVGKWVDLDGGQRVEFDEVIVAVGRAARLQGYGLEDLGIPTTRVIETNDYLETVFPNIYAAGDAAGPFQLTHAAAHQAWFAAVNGLFAPFWRIKADYRVIPAAVFTDPEVARVGLTEDEARDRGIPFEVTRYGIDDLDRAIADSTARGFVKVLTPPGKDRILGVTIVGEHAGDLLAEFVLAMKQGLGLGRILSTIHIYPTLAEANKFVAGNWRRAHVAPRALAVLARFHGWRRG
ncbi:bifunctional TVP38/TMEM64 family protein/FAD-dependent oxidoreductase [Phaeovulum sp. NW3]|uniref:FAD-dependent oxidoreductase n=1 Tax=Phaeovulum sp. NW3 TaxID=2934933 RepID=UPI0020218F12|nr:bifunctional TVP38/TMEM64 family protein/FAD-dependent oxidoreductase [Phaeovulum sp. NW3]MCL7464221.1 FAD-dependent oxidoreductase [Phaeovulum sp. NW3]